MSVYKCVYVYVCYVCGCRAALLVGIYSDYIYMNVFLLYVMCSIRYVYNSATLYNSVHFEVQVPVLLFETLNNVV